MNSPSSFSEDLLQRRPGLQAGLQTLINKTDVLLVNTYGDLGATLKELGSAATLPSLAIAMVAAGLSTQRLQSPASASICPTQHPLPTG